MKKFVWLTASALCAVGLLVAEEGERKYEKLATAHDLMEGVIKPGIDRLAAMKKGGGPQDMEQWKKSNAAASVIGESGFLLLMADRIKDEAWKEGAEKVIDGAKATMLASMRQDMEGWNEGLTAISSGCRTCHTVHKPKKKQ